MFKAVPHHRRIGQDKASLYCAVYHTNNTEIKISNWKIPHAEKDARKQLKIVQVQLWNTKIVEDLQKTYQTWPKHRWIISLLVQQR